MEYISEAEAITEGSDFYVDETGPECARFEDVESILTVLHRNILSGNTDTATEKLNTLLWAVLREHYTAKRTLKASPGVIALAAAIGYSDALGLQRYHNKINTRVYRGSMLFTEEDRIVVDNLRFFNFSAWFM